MRRALLALLVTLPLVAEPRAITPAEKAASEAVADFLARGPVAFFDRLAADAPFASLDRASALNEIAVRTGPREGAAWELRTNAANDAAVFHVLFPSGGEDVLVFRMRGSQIYDIRCMVDSRSAAAKPPLLDRKAVALPPHSYIAAIAALLLGILVRKRGRRLMWMLFTLAFVIVAAQIALIVTEPPRPPAKKPFLELRALLPLRRAMTIGDRDLPILKIADRALSEAALLWQTQATGGGNPNVRELKDTPLATLLRARHASRAGRTNDEIREYDALLKMEPAHDAFWLEAELAAGDRILQQMQSLGSRDAGVYYVASALHSFEARNGDANRTFEQAWRTLPITRDEVIAARMFHGVLQDLSIASLVRVNEPDEHVLPPPALAQNPMKVPGGARAIVSGNFARITIGGARLDLPGGASLAPRGAEVLTATERRRREREDALARVPQLQESGLASAAAQLLAETAAEALIEERKWDEVLALTDSITPDDADISPELVRARIEALVRARRGDEARELAKGRALARAIEKTDDPKLPLDVGALLAEGGAYESAIELYRGASKIKGAPDVQPLIHQAELRQTLATSTVAHQTAHFALHCTAGVPVTVLERVGQLLELELERLTRNFPREPFVMTRVNVVTWDEFSKSITGSDHIVGIYDGDITIPFADVDRFREDVVAILTHELMHAIVAQRSRDRVPRWLQEGIARRMELVARQPNIFQETRDAIPALAVLDATLNHSWNARTVDHAYIESQTFIRFLEDRYGADAVPRLVGSFAGGGTTDTALRELTGKSIDALDREFRTWGLTHAGAFVDATPWPYGQYYSLGIDPKVRAGIRFSKRPR